MGGFAWVTLATNDSYSLGALVLGHSLRRAGTPHDLVVLVTPGVSAAMRTQLASVFSLVQEVNVLDSGDEANLALLERPELGITFTKLHCWRLAQYEKCVFLDADTLVLKNSDELFDREELSAAPDPGWPDCFNSGVFVYRPSLDTFNAVIKFALSKGSFDGGDQGLLNLFFSDWATKDISRHLPFIYNMVSTATYSYLPAYKQFGEGVKIVHFIGSNKPWLQYFDSETRLVRPPHGSEHLQRLLQLWWDIFCSTVHPSLSPDMLGLAGALAQLTLGVPRSAEQTAFEEHMRKQAWEQGSVDYMGRDSFENIWRKITETLAEAPSKLEPQKAATEVPLTKPTPEPILPEPKLPEPEPTTLPSTGTGDAPGITSLTAEPTAPALQSTQASEPSSDSSLPKSTEPAVPPVPLGGPTPPPSPGEQAKDIQLVPHTPVIIEATPPTSPPIVVPTADIKALNVDAPPLETPPVGSTPSKLLSETEIQAPKLKDATQATQFSESLTQTDAKSVAGVSSIPKELTPAQKAKATEQPVPTQEVPAGHVALSTLQQPPSAQEVPATPVVPSTPQQPTSEVPATPIVPSTQQPPSEVPATTVVPSTPQQPPSEQEVPANPVALSTPQPPSSAQEVPATPVVPSTPQQAPSAQEVPATPVALSTPQPPSSAQEVLATPITKHAGQKESPSAQQQPPPTPPAVPGKVEIKSVEETLPPAQISSKKTDVKSTEKKESPPAPVPVEKIESLPAPLQAPPTQAAAPIQPLLLPQVPVSLTTQSLAGKETKSVAEKEVPPSVISDKIVGSPPVPMPSAPTDTKPTAVPSPPEPASPPPPPPAPSSKSGGPPKAPTRAKTVPEEPTPTVPSKTELPPELKPETPVQDAPKKGAETKSPVEQKDASVPSGQSKEPKSAPIKPSAPSSPPSTPDAPPSDQAPVPPKRRSHKGVGASSADQGGASKPAAQSQQSKGSKQGQKGKK